MPCSQFRWTDHRWTSQNQPGRRIRIMKTASLPRPTNVWFAMSSDISASMLVFPKYLRFLTSKVWIRERAEPSAIYRCIHFKFTTFVMHSFYRTYESAEVNLNQAFRRILSRDTASRLWICQPGLNSLWLTRTHIHSHSSKQYNFKSEFFMSILPFRSIKLNVSTTSFWCASVTLWLNPDTVNRKDVSGIYRDHRWELRRVCSCTDA